LSTAIVATCMQIPESKSRWNFVATSAGIAALLSREPRPISRGQVVRLAGVVPEAEHEVEGGPHVPVDPERRAARQVADGRPRLRRFGRSLADRSGRWSGLPWGGLVIS
jgi:hypothetical protein